MLNMKFRHPAVALVLSESLISHTFLTLVIQDSRRDIGSKYRNYVFEILRQKGLVISSRQR